VPRNLHGAGAGSSDAMVEEISTRTRMIVHRGVGL
jgi:hypothetical protein